MDFIATIRFYGRPQSLAEFGVILRERILREPTPIRTMPDRRVEGIVHHYFDVDMNTNDRIRMDEVWRSETGKIDDATGRPYRWNDRLSYEIAETRRAPEPTRWDR